MTMYLFYCPECGKTKLIKEYLEIKKYRDETSFMNIRDGYGRPINHIKCECGNYLSGMMYLEKEDSQDIEYIKNIITEYNKDGNYFRESLLSYAKGRYEYIKEIRKIQ